MVAIDLGLPGSCLAVDIARTDELQRQRWVAWLPLIGGRSAVKPGHLLPLPTGSFVVVRTRPMDPAIAVRAVRIRPSLFRD